MKTITTTNNSAVDNFTPALRKKSILKRYAEHKYFFIMFFPVVLYYLVFHYGTLYGILIAFKDFRPLDGIWSSPWAGLKHFKAMIEDPYFFTVLKNTLIINFGKLLIGFPAPIILAIMLSEIKKERFKKFVQTVSYMPHFLSWVVLAGMLLEILSPSRGPINAIITALGFKPVFFITEPYWFRKILVGSEIWKGIGFGAIIYLAAISGINPEQYEAAEVDGINRFQKLIYITIPSIMPVIIIMLILRAGNIINDDFEQVFNLMNAKVMEVGDVLSTYTYRQGLINMNMSYGAAVGLFKNVIALIMVLSANFVASKISDDTLF